MAKRIRIALMTHTIDGRQASGTALVARKNIEALLEHQDEFELAYIHFQKSDEGIYQHGIRDIVIPEVPWPFNRRFFRQTFFLLTTKERFDIIHWFQPRLYPLFWLAPAKRIVVTVHGAGDVKDDGHFIFMRSVHNWTLRLFRRYVSAAIASSAYSRDDIIRSYHLNPSIVHTVNNGVEPTFKPASAEKVARVREKYQLPEEFFLSVARFAPIKNIVRTLRAFELFCSRHPESAMHFVNIGSKGPEKPVVDDLLAQSHVRDRIHIVDYVEQEDFAAFYSAAFALVFPTLNEGFGLPAVEAMASGTPTIISKTAAPELTDSVAVLVDALDIASITAGMEHMVFDEGSRDRFVSAGLARAREFTWEASTEKVLAIYRMLVSR